MARDHHEDILPTRITFIKMFPVAVFLLTSSFDAFCMRKMKIKRKLPPVEQKKPTQLEPCVREDEFIRNNKKLWSADVEKFYNLIKLESKFSQRYLVRCAGRTCGT